MKVRNDVMQLFKKYGVGFPEGIHVSSMMSIYMADYLEEVLYLFKSHNYNLSEISINFSKVFTFNEEEISDLKTVLEEYDRLGLKSIAEINLSFPVFTKVFLDRVKYCMDAGLSVVNSDSTFRSELYDRNIKELIDKEAKEKLDKESYNMLDSEIQASRDNKAPEASDNEAFIKYSTSMPVNQMPSADTAAVNETVAVNNMNVEDQDIYERIMDAVKAKIVEIHNNQESLADNNLNKALLNIYTNLLDAIKRGEVKFFGVDGMLKNIMFNGMQLSDEEKASVTKEIFGMLGLSSEVRAQ